MHLTTLNILENDSGNQSDLIYVNLVQYVEAVCQSGNIIGMCDESKI